MICSFAARSCRRFLLEVLLTPGDRARAAPIRLRIIATLFGRASNVLMVAFAAAICGGANWSRGGGWVTLFVATCEVGFLLARCRVIVSFQRDLRAGTLSDPESSLLQFGILAILSSCCWGAICFVALGFSRDPAVILLPVLSTVGTAGAIAARNSGAPRLAKMQLACSLMPILAGSLLAYDHAMRLLLLLVPAMATGLVILTDERHAQLVMLIETQDELSRLSRTDPLTKLANRRTFDEHFLDARLARRPLAILMIDVDHFKSFNDRHGHLAGDALLQKLARVLQGQVRGNDLLARHGGEEFVVLLQDVRVEDALAVAERLRSVVADTRFDPLNRSSVSISVGLAVTMDENEYGRLMERADLALYAAKRAGRNQAVVFGPDTMMAA